MCLRCPYVVAGQAGIRPRYTAAKPQLTDVCGIIAAVAENNVCPALIEGLKRLEYRGYDSAGVALLDSGQSGGKGDNIHRVRKPGKVAELEAALEADPRESHIGVAHTRWATHGAPGEANAHPHVSGDRVVVVHNGIIENYEELKKRQAERGFTFTSETDTEVIAHQIMLYLDETGDLLHAAAAACRDLEGSYALGVLDGRDPERLVAARNGSPLIIGVGKDGNYVSSDVQALIKFTQDFIHMENGEVADVRRDRVELFDDGLNPIERAPEHAPFAADAADLGEFRHYMHKEIHEQPSAVADTLEGRLFRDTVPDEVLGPAAAGVLDATRALQIVACGTSYHAASVAKYWFEEFTDLTCRVEIASEFRYRKQSIPDGSLFVTLSQSGETADTLAALELAKSRSYLSSLTICNVAQSSLVRESELALMTHAGPEIGVASTKAFTTQLTALMLLAILLGKRHGMTPQTISALVAQLRNLPSRLEQALELEPDIAQLARRYIDKHHALFLGRGQHYPIAMEGALKMKEVSYIHAEAYPAGELKHGPLALVDSDMPVIAVAPNDHLLAKLKSNLEEVRTRGGILHVFSDRNARLGGRDVTAIELDAPENAVAPVVFSIPLQLLAYHTAVLKGTDVDQPRNLAKAVTVE